jgi:hypothetical protein
MNRILVDANLLCLIVAGIHVPKAIGRHKRLKAYSKDDFKLICRIIEPFQKVITCPHILTETSNLLCHTNDNEKSLLLEGLKITLLEMEEIQIDSLFACNNSAYHRLGLTDAVLLTMEISGAPLVTADLGLALAAQGQGRQAINYNHYRNGAY